MLRNVEKQAEEGRKIIASTRRDLQYNELMQLIEIAGDSVMEAVATAFYMGVNVGHGLKENSDK